MVDIIIPAFNAFDTIGMTLGSIAKQINRTSISVYIINDGSDKSYEEIINFYKDILNIKEIIIENSGPGFARQVGLDSSNSEFVVFMDADDLLYNEYSIINLLNIISDGELAQGKYIEKHIDGETIMEPQYCYMHGKMYRRSFINKHKIKFDIKKREHGDMYEDSSFNQLCLLYSKETKTTDEIVYIYNYNQNSLTKSEENKVQNLYNFVDAMTWFANEVKRRKINNKKLIAWQFCIISMHIYFNYLITKDKSDFVFKNMKKIKSMYFEYIDELPYDEQLNIYKLFSNYPVIPDITFLDFMNKLGN